MIKATHHRTKLHNSRLVLKTIYEHPHCSRADVARVTHLTRPTVSALVAELIDEGLVQEMGVGESAGGKPPQQLAVVDDARLLLCADVSGQQWRGALVNLRGVPVLRTTATPNGATGDEAQTLLWQMLDQLRTAADRPLLGLTVGAPGLIDPARGVVRHAVNLGWQDYPLGERLQARYGLPTHVINDSHAAALAEFTFGAGRGVRHLIVIRVGRGVGAGIVLDGKPLYGDGFGAGEIGHVVVVEDGDLCRCGNRGCLETAVGAPAVLESARARLGDPALTWDGLCAAFGRGEPTVVALMRDVGRHLGVAVAHLIAAFNCQTILIAGRINCFGEPLLDVLRETARQRVLPTLAAQTTLAFSALGSDAVLLGCSALLLQRELGVV